MMGGECATNVLVTVRGGLHSKPPRTGARGTGKERLLESAGIERCTASGVASSLVRYLVECIHLWKWAVKASAQGNG